MKQKDFRKQLSDKGEIEINIKYTIPDTGKKHEERYKFKQDKDKFTAYEDGKLKMETTSANHLYFVYKRLLDSNKKQKNVNYNFFKVDPRIAKGK